MVEIVGQGSANQGSLLSPPHLPYPSPVRFVALPSSSCRSISPSVRAYSSSFLYWPPPSPLLVLSSSPVRSLRRPSFMVGMGVGARQLGQGQEQHGEQGQGGQAPSSGGEG
eukprot:3242140-Pyramimonas_sp.AAC.1